MFIVVMKDGTEYSEGVAHGGGIIPNWQAVPTDQEVAGVMLTDGLWVRSEPITGYDAYIVEYESQKILTTLVVGGQITEIQVKEPKITAQRLYAIRETGPRKALLQRVVANLRDRFKDEFRDVVGENYMYLHWTKEAVSRGLDKELSSILQDMDAKDVLCVELSVKMDIMSSKDLVRGAGDKRTGVSDFDPNDIGPKYRDGILKSMRKRMNGELK